MKEPYSLHIPSCSHGSTNAQVPSVQGDWDIRQRKLFGPKEMGSVGVGPDWSIVITKYTVLVTSWEHVAESYQEKATVDCPHGGLCIGR